MRSKPELLRVAFFSFLTRKMATWTFCDESFPSTAFKQFADFRVKGEMCDVVLCASCLEIPVHRVVMASLSSYFRVMFTGKLAESTQSRIVLYDIDPLALKALVEFGYTGTIEILEENVQSLMCAATLLQINSVRDACCDFLCKELDASNCLGIRALADSLACERLFEVAHKFTVENFETVLHCEEFLLQPFESLISLLESDFLNCSGEEDILDGVVDWLKFRAGRRELALEVIKRTHLMRAGPTFLADKLLKEPVIKSDPECVELILEAIEALRSHSVRGFWEIAPCARKFGELRKEVLLAIGGECAGTTLACGECYSPQEGVWNCEIETIQDSSHAPLAKMKQSRTYAAVASSGKHVYAMGGASSWKILDIVERYEWPENKWFELSSMCVPRLGASATILDGQVMVMGGCGKAGYLSSVESYDPLIDKWALGKPMRGRRSYLGVQALCGLVYAVGGFGGTAGYPDGWLNTVECMDPVTGRWASVAPMSHSRAYMGLVANEGE